MPLAAEVEPPPRLETGMGELDRVLGGGFVRGSAVLIGGDPGIGKSTLMLQAAAAVAHTGKSVVYLSGEESVEQVQLRARRLGLARAPVALACETDLSQVLPALDGPTAPALLVVDSIQTVSVPEVEAASGTVSQIRAAADQLVRFAKRRGTVLVLVGHVTKDGQIAGPRLLEHMVDTVLDFEGERGLPFRLLRAVKNRFGPADELGIFEMRESGLVAVADASGLFLGERSLRVPGACVFAGIEGTRPVLVEIQVLLAPSPFATPRRTVVGWDAGRLATILAVLEARCGLTLAGRDVYLNVAGGLQVREPGADLAVAAAILSSLAGRPMPEGTVAFGEIGLAGEVRPVGRVDLRLREAAKLGFRQVLLPAASAVEDSPLTLLPVARLAELVDRIGGPAAPRRRGERSAP
ncbi:DNA repair protein RadA [bacterium HR40]|nr:DNA repair protein RadA [bacterium HR40]